MIKFHRNSNFCKQFLLIFFLSDNRWTLNSFGCSRKSTIFHFNFGNSTISSSTNFFNKNIIFQIILFLDFYECTPINWYFLEGSNRVLYFLWFLLFILNSWLFYNTDWSWTTTCSRLLLNFINMDFIFYERMNVEKLNLGRCFCSYNLSQSLLLFRCFETFSWVFDYLNRFRWFRITSWHDCPHEWVF